MPSGTVHPSRPGVFRALQHLTQHPIIRSIRMRESIHLPNVRANRICQWAVDHYLVSMGRGHQVSFSVPKKDKWLEDDGWCQISLLMDRTLNIQYKIYWHPETDGVRIQGEGYWDGKRSVWPEPIEL